MQGHGSRALPLATGGTAAAPQAQRHQPKEEQHPSEPPLLRLRLALIRTGAQCDLGLGDALLRQLLGTPPCQGVDEGMKSRLQLLQQAGKGDLLPNHSGEQSGGMRQQGVLHAAPPFGRDTAVLAALPIFPSSYLLDVLRLGALYLEADESGATITRCGGGPRQA
jgi:hypothetical protein